MHLVMYYVNTLTFVKELPLCRCNPQGQRRHHLQPRRVLRVGRGLRGRVSHLQEQPPRQEGARGDGGGRLFCVEVVNNGGFTTKARMYHRNLCVGLNQGTSHFGSKM